MNYIYFSEQNNRIRYNTKQFYSQCYIKKYSNTTSNIVIDTNYGKDLWNKIAINKHSQYCAFLLKMNLFMVNNSFFYHRLYSTEYTKRRLSVDGNFPHNSYYRLIPKNKINSHNIITHTYEVQRFLYEYQHPLQCSNKKYLIIRGFIAGHGAEIHVITSYLSLAISTNRIAIFDPYYKSRKAFGKFCGKEQNWLCFLEQLTNCSLSSNIFSNSKQYNETYQNEKYLFVDNVQYYKKIVPSQIKRIIKDAPIYKKKLLHYWRIEGSTYIFRINRRTDIITDRIIAESLGNQLINGCFNIWIRHGDKYKEMKLLNAEDYIPSYIVYQKFTKTSLPVYLSTDDPNVTAYFSKNNSFKTFYLHFKRNNDNLKGNMNRGDEMTLNFIADIKASLYCNAFSGTRKSNVIRLIDELRSTIGYSANSIFFENGDIKLADTSYEISEYW